MNSQKIKNKKLNYFSLWFYISSHCNLRCKHCCLEDTYFSQTELSSQDLEKILEDYIYFLRFFKIRGKLNLVGGEPLMRKNIFNFLKKTAQYKEISVGILTNGTLLNKNAILKLKKFKVSGIGLSLEGMRKNHDFIRGKGNFDKTIIVAKKLINAKIPVGIEFTANKLNYKELPQVVKLCEKIGISLLGANYFIPTGRGKAIKNLMLKFSQIKEYYNMAKFLSEFLKKKKSKTEVRPSHLLWLLVNSTSKEKFYCPNLQKRMSLTIMPKGDVFFCRHLPIKLGNIKNQTLLDIYLSVPSLKKLKYGQTKKMLQCEFIKAYRNGR